MLETLWVQYLRHGFHPWVRKIPLSRKWWPSSVFLPGKFHGLRSLAGYSPWGHKKVRHDWHTDTYQLRKEERKIFKLHRGIIKLQIMNFYWIKFISRMSRRETGKFLFWSHHPEIKTLLCAHMCPRNRILQQKKVMADFGIAQCPWSDKSLNSDKFLNKIFNSFFFCQRICRYFFMPKSQNVKSQFLLLLI